MQPQLTDEAAEVILDLAAALDRYGSTAAHADEIGRLLTEARTQVDRLAQSGDQARSIVAETAARHAMPRDVAAFLRRSRSGEPPPNMSNPDQSSP